MAYDGNGTFLPLPAPTFPAQPGIVIYAEYFNANLLNIHQGLTAALPRNGEAAMAGPLRMAGFKLTELGAENSAGEAVEWGQWQNSYLNATYQVLNVPNLGLTPDGTRVTNVNWVDGQFSARFPNLSAPVLANATEVNYLIGLTGDIQSQLSNQVAGPIHAATAKTAPTDADELGITDSAASWGLKKLTFANLAAWARGINLAGLSIATDTAITASDTVLDALGKLQAQVSAKQGTLVSGTNIKTVNGGSLLGSGDLLVDGGGPLIDSLTITYNGDGAIATLTEDGVVKAFAYNGDGTINTVSWPIGALTRTETYSYSSGVLTGMTAVEA